MKILAKFRGKSDYQEMDLFDTERNPLVWPTGGVGGGGVEIVDLVPGISLPLSVPGTLGPSGLQESNELHGITLSFSTPSFVILYGGGSVDLTGTDADGSKGVQLVGQVTPSGMVPNDVSSLGFNTSVSPVNDGSFAFPGYAASAMAALEAGSYLFGVWLNKTDDTLDATATALGVSAAIFPTAGGVIGT